MAIRVALLRAVNLAGHGKVSMADLKAMCARLGFAQATTLLNSGNLVFDDPQSRPPDVLAALLESTSKAELGLATDYMVRSPDQWAATIAANPFPEMASDDPGHLVVVFLNGPAPDTAAIDRLNAAIVGREVVAADGRELYITYPDGIGTSKLTSAVIERALGRNRGTARNWNTVLKIGAAIDRLGG